MTRHFGLPPSPPPRPMIGVDVLLVIVLAACAIAAGAGLMFGALWIQHLLRGWGWHV